MDKKRKPSKSLWKRMWQKFIEIVVVTITLSFTYSLLAFWGVIVLIMAGFEKAGVILREANRTPEKKVMESKL